MNRLLLQGVGGGSGLSGLKKTQEKTLLDENQSVTKHLNRLPPRRGNTSDNS